MNAHRLALGALLMGTAIATPSLAQDQQVITSHGISTFGDLKYRADFTHFEYANPDAPQGGTIILQAAGADYDSFNPFILKGQSTRHALSLYDSLLTSTLDETGSYYAYVAETITYPEDRSWVEFKIREDARFPDGHPIRSSDIAFSHELLTTQGHPYYANTALKDVVALETPDELTVRYEFAQGANTRDLPAVAGSMAIFPEHFWADKDFSESGTELVPMGSSQFEIANFEPGRFIELCKIDDYWAKDLPFNRGVNNFDCYRFDYYLDSLISFEGFKGGRYYYREENVSKTWATAYDFPAIDNGWVKQELIPDENPNGTQGYWINLRKEKFQDPLVRQAIAELFNFEFANDSLFYNQYTRTDSFWENTDMQASGLPEGAELAVLEQFADQLPETIFTQPAYVPPVQKIGQVDRANLRRVGRLLDEAGWKIVDGMRQKDGVVLSIEYLTASPTDERIIVPAFIELAKRVGIDATLKQVDAAQMAERTDSYDYDMRGAGFAMDLNPDNSLPQLFGSYAAQTNGFANLSGIADPVVDELIEQILATQTREDLIPMVKALDRILRSLHIWVPNFYIASDRVAYWDIFGRPEVKPKYAIGASSLWWLDQEKFDRLVQEGVLQ